MSTARSVPGRSLETLGRGRHRVRPDQRRPLVRGHDDRTPIRDTRNTRDSALRWSEPAGAGGMAPAEPPAQRGTRAGPAAGRAERLEGAGSGGGDGRTAAERAGGQRLPPRPHPARPGDRPALRARRPGAAGGGPRRGRRRAASARHVAGGRVGPGPGPGRGALRRLGRVPAPLRDRQDRLVRAALPLGGVRRTGDSGAPAGGAPDPVGISGRGFRPRGRAGCGRRCG